MTVDAAVGQRIAKAREFLGLTQAIVAARMNLARTTQVAIEQGHRAVAVEELQRYGEILGRPLSYFFGEGMWSDDGDFRAVFRQIAERLDTAHTGPPRRPGRPRGASEAPPEKRALMVFEALCRQHLDLQRVNGLPAARLPDLPVPVHHSSHEAELLAATVRAHLDVGGEAPLANLRRVVEQAFGLSVFVMDDLGRLEVAGFQHPRAGACLLLAQAPPQVLRFELACALGHLLSNREQACVHVSGNVRRSATSGFTTAFAAALLVPPRGLRERYAAIAFERGVAEPLALAYLARLYGVSMAVLRGRLQTQRLLPSSASGARRPAPADPAALPEDDELGEPQGAAVDGDAYGETRWAALPEHYVFLALRAYRRGHIDAARLAECLCVSADQALARLAAYELGVAD